MTRTTSYIVLSMFLGAGLTIVCVDAGGQQPVTMYRKHGRFENVRLGTPEYSRIKELLWNSWLHERPTWIEADFVNMHGRVSRTTYILTKDAMGRLLLHQYREIGDQVREVIWDRIERVVPGYLSKQEIPGGTELDPEEYSLRLIDTKHEVDTYLQ